jgi:hypothetical protein
LIPGIGDARVAFCATEQGGNLPSEIRTALVADGDGGGWRMSGRKQWSTMGQLADELLVFATDGQDDKGRNRLALVRIPATRDGVEISPGHATQFVPEISHASIALSDVRVEPGERLDGDAYVRYLKPFRTVEDTHVHAALLGWLVGVGRRAEWPRDILARILALVGSVRDVAAEDVRSPGVHVALAGVIASTSRLVDELTPLWDRVDAGVRDRWRRDRALLNVAGKAREQRAAVAWERLTPG